MTESIATDRGTCCYPDCDEPRAPRQGRHGQPPRYCTNKDHTAQTAYLMRERQAKVPTNARVAPDANLSSAVTSVVEDTHALNSHALAQLGISPPRGSSLEEQDESQFAPAAPPPPPSPLDVDTPAPVAPLLSDSAEVTVSDEQPVVDDSATSITDAQLVLCNQVQTLTLALVREARSSDNLRTRLQRIERDLEDERQRGATLRKEYTMLATELSRAHGAVQRALATVS